MIRSGELQRRVTQEGLRGVTSNAFALRACVLRSGLLRYGDALAIHLLGEAVQSLTFTGPMLSPAIVRQAR